MTVTRICPDDLVLAARSGALNPQDEARLSLHLTGCSRCRAALDVGRAFDAALGARVGDDAIATRIAARVTQRPARRWLAYAASGGLLLLSGSVAVAAVGRETLNGWIETIIPTSAQPAASAQPAPRRQAPSIESSIGSNVEAELTEVAPSPETGATATTSAAPEPPAAAPVPTTLAPRATRTFDTTESAAELFASANSLRSQGKAAEAERRYLALQTRYPAATEARVSLVSLARLELAARPAQALRHFDAYLAQSAHNTLTEEALFGRASALARLGRVEAERTAWKQLLDRFPSSVYAERAKSRLATP
jgi:hypothetical protein